MGARIVHVTAHYPPFLGGLEKVVESLVACQRARGLDVRVLTSLDEPLTDGSPEFVRHIRAFEVADTSIMPTLPLELLRLARGSIVHLHIAQAFVPEAVYTAHVLRGLPYVAHLHLDVGPSGPAGFLLRAYKPFVLRKVLRGAGVVVVFTDDQRQTIAGQYHLDPERIEVVPNGVDETFFFAGERSVHEKPRLLFVGRLSVQKNIPLLLHALQGVSELFETTLVGDGELGTELRSMVDGLRLRNVRFYGRADGSDLLRLYREADVLVLPSEREGMPLVLLEAQAMGLPIVATDIPGNRDVVAHQQSGLLVPLEDPSAMRRALLSVTGDKAQYSRHERASPAARGEVLLE